ncbi:thioredoxin-1 [Biomphalaria pfeifferi]|uniref:Thioredoxin-1 n=1 Tax=Biomphalaria pfeifferi TaxID=112525 RepID=A0AAD8C030_BIOPF|nr:thioredoxin-1 [Biomphalaria pfeifferi]
MGCFGSKLADKNLDSPNRSHPDPAGQDNMKTVATKLEFDQLISTEKNLVVVDFFATWCGPCKVIAPQLQKWSEEYDDVTFVKIDVDENDETAEACGISAMPTFFLYKNGKKVDEIVGANAERLLEKIIANK